MQTFLMFRRTSLAHPGHTSRQSSGLIEIEGLGEGIPREALVQALNYDDAASVRGPLDVSATCASMPVKLPSAGLVVVDQTAQGFNQQGSQNAGTSSFDHGLADHGRPHRRNAYLTVVAGPDVGRQFHLPRGTYSIGRRDADVSIRDPAMPTQAGVVVHSAQGFALKLHRGYGQSQGPKIPTTRHLSFGDTFTLGSTRFRLEEDREQEKSEPQSVQTSWPLPAITITNAPRAQRPLMMTVGAVMPVVLGLAMVLIMGSWLFMLFALMSVVTAGIPALLQWRDKKKLNVRIQAELAKDKRQRQYVAPDWGTLRTWLRNPRGSMPGGSPSSGSATEGQREDPVREASLALPLPIGETDRLPVVVGLGAGTEQLEFYHQDCPAIVTLSSQTPTIFCGMRTRVQEVLRACFIRLLITDTSRRLTFVLIGDGSWLPSLARAAGKIHYYETVEAFAQLHAPASAGPVIVFASRSTLGEARGPKRFETAGSNYPPLFVAFEYLDEPVAASRAAEKSVRGGEASESFAHEIRVDTGQWINRTRSDGEESSRVSVLLDGMSAETTTVFLEILALSEVPAPETSEPKLGQGHSDHEHPALSSANSLLLDAGVALDASKEAMQSTPKAASSGNGLKLDLATDGPHMLVAGTSGSGKSEALKSMVWSITRNYLPSDVAFFHFDFKGGSTLGEFAALPHTISVETDLTRADASRMIRGIRSELSRREHLFQKQGVADYPSWRAIADTRNDLPKISRLVIVVDELRMLLSAMPEAMNELASISTIGRSLGVHLVLSTQRPLGVVSPDIRANIGISVLLRVASQQESLDVIGTPQATSISHRFPGQGYVKVGSQPAQRVQFPPPNGTSSGWMIHRYGDVVGPALSTLHVSSAEPPLTPAQRWLIYSGGVTIDPAPPTALPVALPNEVDGELLVTLMEHTIRLISHSTEYDDARSPEAASPEVPIYLGVGNDETMGDLEPVLWDLQSSPRLSILTGMDGGGSAVATSLIRQFLEHSSRVIVIDGAEMCGDFADDPEVYAYASNADSIAIVEILERVHDELMLSYDAHGAHTLVMVTGWSAVLSRVGPRVATSLEQLMSSLVRLTVTGRVAVVALGARELTGTTLFAALESRLYLPFGLGSEVKALWPRMVEIPDIRGRGVLVVPGGPQLGREVQCLNGTGVGTRRPLSPVHGDAGRGSGCGWATASAEDTYPETATATAGTLVPTTFAAPNLRGLPKQVSPDATLIAGLLAQSLAEESESLAFPLGISSPTHELFVWRPGRIGLIAGGSGTGKTSILMNLARTLETQGLPNGCVRITGSTVSSTDLQDIIQSPPRVLLIDDVDLIPDALRAETEKLLQSCGQTIVTAKADFKSLHRMPGALLQRPEGADILLSPRTPQEADALGWQGCPVDPSPGRGFQRLHGRYVRFHAWS
ncbi:hypothetical protein BHE16_03345 [Neomicrococcus aestuarii]|uniref:FtsK domain-containing protein n=2 Tax=Neomicrococcus aestuarii TaxID=556325 RepID=A0A1L2ZM51_9MICC|nr:hypothetical protein BHE16_03345 [Neomicrococcus aestuarii]